MELYRLDEAQAVTTECRNQRRKGTKASKEAFWLGFVRFFFFLSLTLASLTVLFRASEGHVESLKGRSMFETDAQRLEAVSAGLTDTDSSVALGNEYSRVCAPTTPKYLGMPVSFIFWTKDSPDDDEPSWDKVVSPSFT